jgi:hypothetical protein
MPLWAVAHNALAGVVASVAEAIPSTRRMSFVNERLGIQPPHSVPNYYPGDEPKATTVAPALPTETPPDRRRKFSVIQGGRA